MRLSLLKRIAEEAERREIALYIVGGFVRDLLLGTPSVDFDLVTEGDAIRLARSLAEKYRGSVSSHQRFGTAKWQLDPEAEDLQAALEINGREREQLPETLDFVTARSEFYLHPTALPTIERGSIKLDLHRRDFTINTLALRLDGRYYGQLLDHWGGGQDLQERVIRVLHSLSFVDDPTRMLRAVRLEQRLDFTIESRTMELLKEARPLLKRVSGDRIRSELALIFRERSLFGIMDRLQGLGLLAPIHPGLQWSEGIRNRWRRIQDLDLPEQWSLAWRPDPDLLHFAAWTYHLPEDEVKEISERLHLPGRMRDTVQMAAQLGAELRRMEEDAKASEIVNVLDKQSEESLVAAWLAEEQEGPRAAIDRYLTQWRKLEPVADGETLKDMGLPPGPLYSRLLRQLRAAWLNGEVKSEEEERQLLERMVARAQDDG